MKRIVAVLAVCALASAQSPIDTKVDELLKRMTLEEKVGQLTQVGALDFVPGAPKPEEAVRKGNAGSVLWLSDTKKINALQKIAVTETRLKIPLIFGLDVIHGYRTIFPMPLALAASWDESLIERTQHTAAKEARAAGISWTFAPMLDIARDIRWGRMMEGAGEDPYLGAAVARAQVKGFQGDDLSRPDRMLACAKHFAGYGAADGGRDYDSVQLGEAELWNVYFPPFKAAVDAGVGTFMSAYMDLNDIPATGNKFLLTDVLRKAWKFPGFVVSDANAVGDLVTHGFARDKSDSAFKAITAGLDMDMASNTYMTNLPALVNSGRVPMSTIDAAVKPILAAKFKLGLFEHPYVDETAGPKAAADPANRALAREAARKSAVLLRNEGNLLPLKKDAARKIAVIGPLADDKRNLLTMWSGFDLDPNSTVPLSRGIENKLDSLGITVQNAPGVQISKTFHSMFESMTGAPPAKAWTDAEAKQQFDRAVELARNSDLVILTLGELALMSGELASQSNMEFPGRQQALMEAVVATGKPVVLVLVNTRPLNITWASTHIPAILEMWHPGTEGGNALADLLFGDAAPGGKLPITWPRSSGQAPMYYSHKLTHMNEKSAMKLTDSRYWDVDSSPLYAFGHGLSYTKTAVTNLKVTESARVNTGAIKVSVDVENTGAREGDEVVQLYIHQQAGNASRPVRELKGFRKVTLKPGEKKTLDFTLGKAELSYWNSGTRSWIEDAERFDIWVGTDSNAPLHGNFTITQ